MNIEEAHIVILTLAADIANHDLRMPIELRGSGEVFREASNQSDKGGLCLELEHSFVYHVQNDFPYPQNDHYFNLLHDIGKQAIISALQQRSDLFGGMIVGQAHLGKNYFDRFDLTLF